MPNLYVVRGFSAARLSAGKKAAAGLRVWTVGTAAQRRFKEDFVSLFTFPKNSSAGILITIFTYVFSKPYF